MKLALFFTRGVSVVTWDNQGLLDREKRIYEEHLKHDSFKKIYWLTYGSSDRKLVEELKKQGKLHKDIEVLPMPKLFNIPKIGSFLYSLLLPFYYKTKLQDCDIYKTNQTDGSWSAVISKKLYKKKLLYRTGFTMSQLENNLKRFNIFIRKCIEITEKIAYQNCNQAIVSSQHDLKYVINKYKVDVSKIHVIYNFIEREKFYDLQQKRKNEIIFIGRLSEEKNIFNLIQACDKAELKLSIYGFGYQKEKIEEFILNNNYNARILGKISNDIVPDILNSVKYFALVSVYEGMPKALIEAIACGCICVGTDVDGINEVVTKNSGILAKGISSDEIYIALLKAKKLSNIELRTLKRNMDDMINSYFTLENIIKKERKIFMELMN